MDERLQEFLQMIRIFSGELDLSEKDIAFLEEQTDLSRAVVIFICFLSGVTLAQVKEMTDKGLSNDGILDMRTEILSERVRDLDTLTAEVKGIRKETSARLEDLEKLREYYETKLKESWERERETLQDALRMKEVLLTDARSEIVRLKECLRKEAESCEETLPSGFSDSPEERLFHFHRKKKRPPIDVPTADVRNIDREQREFEEAQFMNNILRNPEFSREQKEYLLSCFSSGMSYWKLVKVAFPDLEVGFMQAILERPGAGQ